MRIIKSSDGTEIRIFASAKELPIDRYTEFQKYLLLESGVGSTFDSFAVKLDRLKALVLDNKIKEFESEIENTKLCLNAVAGGFNYNTMAFACLVESIGGKIESDLSLEGIINVKNNLEKLQITQQNLNESIEDVKKK